MSKKKPKYVKAEKMYIMLVKAESDYYVAREFNDASIEPMTKDKVLEELTELGEYETDPDEIIIFEVKPKPIKFSLVVEQEPQVFVTFPAKE